MVFDFFCDQDASQKESSYSFRIATISYRLAAVIIVPAYSATITAFLAVIIPEVPFKNLKGFIDNGEYRLGTVPGRYPYKYFQRATDLLLRKIFDEYLVMINQTDAMKKMCTQNFAFISPDNDIYNFKAKCDFWQIEEPITFVITAMDLGVDTPYRNLLRHNLITIYSSGIHKKIRKKLLGEAKTKEVKELEFVDFEEVYLMLSIVAIGICLGLIIFMIEISVKKINVIKNRRKKKNSVKWADDTSWPLKRKEHAIVDEVMSTYIRKMSVLDRRFSMTERKCSVMIYE